MTANRQLDATRMKLRAPESERWTLLQALKRNCPQGVLMSRVAILVIVSAFVGCSSVPLTPGGLGVRQFRADQVQTCRYLATENINDASLGAHPGICEMRARDSLRNRVAELGGNAYVQTNIHVSPCLSGGTTISFEAYSCRVQARGEEVRADRQRADSYCQGLFRDVRLDPIRTKLGIAREGEGTFEMLLDNTKATDTEKPALVVWAKKKEECKNEVVAHFRKFSPPVYPEYPTIYEAGFIRFQFLIADLYNGVLTYAEFSRKRKELNADTGAKMAEIRQLYQQRSAEARHRAAQLANDARRAAALEEQVANQRYQIQMQQLEALRPRSRSFTCTTYYNMTTCD